MITTNKLTVRFGSQTLFENINIKFVPGHCYGVIGANGAGKSTLLRVISGDVEPTSGEVHIQKGMRIAVLKQDHFAYDQYPVIETVNKDSIEEESNDDNQYKQPYSKRKIAKKFLFAMGGVAISSFVIFFLLTIYNRVRENYLNQIKNNGKEDSLETPDDLNSAVKCFLNKTKWS